MASNTTTGDTVPSSLVPVVLSFIPTAERFRTLSYLVVVAISISLYDIALTIDQEIDLIWNSSISLGKILYYVIRYLSLLDATLSLVYMMYLLAPISFCEFEMVFDQWTILFMLLLLQAIAISRTIAIWDRNTIVSAYLIFSALITDSVIFAEVIQTTLNLNITREFTNMRPLIGCISLYGEVPISTLSVPSWGCIIFFDTNLFFLTLLKVIQNYKQSPTQLRTIIIRDGVLFYFTILALTITNLLFGVLPISQTMLRFGMAPILRSFTGVTGGRMILNLRSAAYSANSEDVQEILDSIKIELIPSRPSICQ